MKYWKWSPKVYLFSSFIHIFFNFNPLPNTSFQTPPKKSSWFRFTLLTSSNLVGREKRFCVIFCQNMQLHKGSNNSPVIQRSRSHCQSLFRIRDKTSNPKTVSFLIPRKMEDKNTWNPLQQVASMYDIFWK